jgi:hypothetical protein
LPSRQCRCSWRRPGRHRPLRTSCRAKRAQHLSVGRSFLPRRCSHQVTATVLQKQQQYGLKEGPPAGAHSVTARPLCTGCRSSCVQVSTAELVIYSARTYSTGLTLINSLWHVLSSAEKEEQPTRQVWLSFRNRDQIRCWTLIQTRTRWSPQECS